MQQNIITPEQITRLEEAYGPMWERIRTGYDAHVEAVEILNENVGSHEITEDEYDYLLGRTMAVKVESRPDPANAICHGCGDVGPTTIVYTEEVPRRRRFLCHTQKFSCLHFATCGLPQ